MGILVTGGAGYIGSFMTKRLLDGGYEVVVADSLLRGHKSSVDPRAKLEVGDLGQETFLADLFTAYKFDAVIHFAGYISTGESMENPGLYFLNNAMVPVKLLEKMNKYHVENFIFSSTAAVYGDPIQIPIPEDHPKHPTNPYGQSKLMVEQILEWYQKIYSINFVALRYFNAAGAALDGSMGEDHKPESHIIPNVIHAMLTNSEFLLYGTDYHTQDGTAVRDYIHVLDLVEAHVLALKKLEKDSGGFIYNVGTGKGYSNKEVIGMVEQICDKKVIVKQTARRLGDAETLVADPTCIKKDLHVEPKYSDLKTIVETAWRWHKKRGSK